MQTVTTIDELRDINSAWRKAGERIAFVPTMGNLHRGHTTLIDAAKQHTDRVVASIFVNPLQFGRGGDFGSYPRHCVEAGPPCKARLCRQWKL